MAGGVTAIKTALGVMIAFAFLSWILSLIGLAGLQRNCYDLPSLAQTTGGGLSTGGESISPLAYSLPHVGIRGFSRSYGCGAIYRYYWWMFAAECVTLLGLTIMAAVGLLAASGLAWMAWLTVLTTLFIQGSDSFLALDDILGGRNMDYSRLTAAGWILTSIANLGLIFLLGWRPRKANRSSGGPIKY